jgi:hypothetical protein
MLNRASYRTARVYRKYLKQSNAPRTTIKRSVMIGCEIWSAWLCAQEIRFRHDRSMSQDI